MLIKDQNFKFPNSLLHLLHTYLAKVLDHNTRAGNQSHDIFHNDNNKVNKSRVDGRVGHMSVVLTGKSSNLWVKSHTKEGVCRKP